MAFSPFDSLAEPTKEERGGKKATTKSNEEAKSWQQKELCSPIAGAGDFVATVYWIKALLHEVLFATSAHFSSSL